MLNIFERHAHVMRTSSTCTRLADVTTERNHAYVPLFLYTSKFTDVQRRGCNALPVKTEKTEKRGHEDCLFSTIRL